MSQLPKPKVVCLLIQQGCHWQFQRITSLNVQFLREGRLTNATRKSQAVDFLIIVMVFVLLPMRIGIKAIGAAVISRCLTPRWIDIRGASLTRLGWWNGWSAWRCHLSWWARQCGWARWSGWTAWKWICQSGRRGRRRCRWKAWTGPDARLRCRTLTHRWISNIRSRLWHIELRTKLRSKLRSWHTLWLPNRWLHGPTPSWKERQLLSYLLGCGAWISSVSSRHRWSGAIWLRHDCAGRFVVWLLKTDCNLVKKWMKNVIWTSKPSSNEFLKPHVHQPQNPSSKTNKMTEVTNQRKKRRKTKTTKQNTDSTTGDRCIQIVATVHFDPKLLSREILERWFEVLFRPNIAKITKAVLIRLKD